MDELDRISQWIERKAYIQAYSAIFRGLEASPNRLDLLELSRKLSAVMRSGCVDLASSKATEMSQELHELECLLMLVVRLNGEGIYL